MLPLRPITRISVEHKIIFLISSMPNKRTMFALGAVSLVVAGTLLWYREAIKKIYSQRGSGKEGPEMFQEAGGMPPPPPPPLTQDDAYISDPGLTRLPSVEPESPYFPNEQWVRYENSRYGLALRYPAMLTLRAEDNVLVTDKATGLRLTFEKQEGPLFVLMALQGNLRDVHGYLTGQTALPVEHMIINGIRIVQTPSELYFEHGGVVFVARKEFNAPDEAYTAMFAILGTVRFF